MSTRPIIGPASQPGLARTGVAAVCLAQFLSVLDGFIVSVALPQMETQLRIGHDDLQWIPNAYGLSYGGLLLLSGRLADRFGRIRVFVTGLIVLTGGSVLAALAVSPIMLFAGRGVQGIGTAIASPAGLGLLVASFPEGRDRTRMLGLITLSGGVGMVSAGAFGGVLTGLFGWRAVFWFAVPVAAGAIVLMLTAGRHRQDDRQPAAVNARDALLSVLGLSAIVYAGSRVDAAGLSSPQVWGFGIAGLLVLLAFGWAERSSSAPLIPARLFRSAPVRGANLLALLFPAGFIAPQFLGTQVLQGVQGLTPLQTGFSYLPLALIVLATTPLATQLTDHRGPRLVAAAGFLLLAISIGYLVITIHWPYWAGFLPATCGAGAGVTAVFVALAVSSVQGVTHEGSGLASGLFNTSQQVGGALVLALSASVAAGFTRSAANGGAEPGSALATGLQAGLLVTALISLAGGIGALLLLGSRPPAQSTNPGQSINPARSINPGRSTNPEPDVTQDRPEPHRPEPHRLEPHREDERDAAH